MIPWDTHELVASQHRLTSLKKLKMHVSDRNIFCTPGVLCMTFSAVFSLNEMV